MSQQASANINEVPKFLTLKDLIGIILDNKFPILGFTLVVGLAAFFISSAMQPVYRSTATVQIEPKEKQVIQIDEVYDAGGESREYLRTQYEILRSRELALRVLEKIDVKKYPELDPESTSQKGVLSQIKSLLRSLVTSEGNQPASVLDEAALLKELQLARLRENLKVEQVFNTQLINVHYDAQNPKLAALVANNLVEAYFESNLQVRVDATKQATEWLNQRMPDVKQRLEESEKNLQEFRERQKIVNVGGSRTLAQSELAENNQRLLEARKQASELASIRAKIQQANADVDLLQQIPALLRSPLVQVTKEGYLKATDNVVELRSRYGKKHPAMQSAIARQEEAKAAFAQQLQKAAEGVYSDYEIARDNVAALESVVSRDKVALQQLDRKEYDQQVLEREVETNRDLYDQFLKRFKETDVAGNFETINARVIDKAVIPAKPFKPNVKLITALSIFSAFIVAILLSLVRYFLDDTVQSEQALETLTKLPTLGRLPIIDDSRLSKKAGLAVLEDDKSAFAEGMRTVRTSILLSGVDQKYKSLLICSSMPNEGKSTVALNLAATMAKSEKVLLIDGDFRKPTLSKTLNASADMKGLCDVMAGLATVDEAITRCSKGDFDVILTGSLPPNPTELIGSEKMNWRNYEGR